MFIVHQSVGTLQDHETAIAVFANTADPDEPAPNMTMSLLIWIYRLIKLSLYPRFFESCRGFLLSAFLGQNYITVH